MKRIILYGLILGALFFAPVESAEVAKLEPVQAVWMYTEGDSIVLETDTQDKGSGATVEEALADMKQKSAGIIYLDTAEYVLVTAAEQEIPTLEPYIKGSARLCQWDGNGELDEAVKYMDAHRLGTKVRRWKPNDKLPNLPI